MSDVVSKLHHYTRKLHLYLDPARGAKFDANWGAILKATLASSFLKHNTTFWRVLDIHLQLTTTIFWNFHPYLLGEMIQFDEHIFQMGWFNHQLL